MIGDGSNIRFWTDKWLGGLPIIESVKMEVP